MYCLTFPVKYSREPHPSNLEVHPDGYIGIEAESYSEAERMAYAIFNINYAFIYTHEKFLEGPDPVSRFHPLGPIGYLVRTCARISDQSDFYDPEKPDEVMLCGYVGVERGDALVVY